jgi:putative restriction endonuclease
MQTDIALCPNMHRAFDRGLIAIDDDYRVVVSKNFMESYSHYTIKQYDRKEINLPENRRMWPGKKNLRNQREMAKLQTLLI